MSPVRYMPDWLPGTSFKRTARLWRSEVLDLVEKPYAYVRKQMKNGVPNRSFVTARLEEMKEEGMTAESESVLKWTAAGLYAGGIDTTTSGLACFFLAMTVYPEVQRRAQSEIGKNFCGPCAFRLKIRSPHSRSPEALSVHRDLENC